MAARCSGRRTSPPSTEPGLACFRRVVCASCSTPSAGNADKEEVRISPIYAESSAVLAWLLGEPQGDEVADAFAEADAVLASDLTLVECERVLIRAWSTGLSTEGEMADQLGHLARAAAHWVRLRVSEDVVERARRPFPIEPIRTLDALHIASALVARTAVPELRVVSLDQRVRANAERLGFDTAP
jgi:hypothetical protein